MTRISFNPNVTPVIPVKRVELNRPLDKPTILIISLETAQHEVLKYRFNNSNFNTITAKSEEEALSLIARNKVDLIVFDLEFDQMKSIKTNKLLSSELLTNIPVILIASGSLSSLDRDKTPVIQKPYSIRSLTDLVKQLLDSNNE